ncbi:tetratricopeptide repeat protein, partial [bacterium]|nr:tetratricopeptide repeat protein [bacterium]
GEDMVDSDHPDLKQPGQRLKLLSDFFCNGGKIENLPAVISDCPEKISQVLASVDKKLVSLIKNFITPFWTITGEDAYIVALFTELSYLSETSLTKILPNWLQPGFTLDKLSEEALSVCLDFANKNNKYDWIEVICEIGSEIWPKNQRFPALWAETLAEQGKYELSLELIDEFEKKGLYSPWLRHWRTWNFMMNGNDSAALNLARDRLNEEPRDIAAAFVAGDIHLKHHRVDQAIKAYTWAFKYGVGNGDALISLSRAFNAAYLPDQAELCLENLEKISPGIASKVKLPAELLIKCTVSGTKAFINDQPVGECPFHIRNLSSGSVQIRWEPTGEKYFETVVELLPGHNQKYKYDPSSGDIHEELSRDGMITLFSDGEMIELPTLMKEYMVNNLSDLPTPQLDEFFVEND